MRGIISALLLASVSAMAQVTVDIQFDQEHFLRSESLPVRVRIANLSGRTLHLGQGLEWLTFEVEGREGILLAKKGEIPIAKPFDLESSKTATLRADLMPYFNLSEPGHYALTVNVKVPELNKEVSTPPKPFDIVSGTKIWERAFGVPGTTPPETRKYALQQATFLKQLRLYVRVTDADEETVYRVVPLGMLLSFSTPETQIDRSSNLHVLFQNSARGFFYGVISPDGELIIRQTYDYGDVRPRLRAEEDGRVVVANGQRRILLSDLPPPRVANTNEMGEGKLSR